MRFAKSPSTRVGLLSNVDDRLARRTGAFRLIEPELALTSQRLGAFKPNPEIYQAAVAAVAPEASAHAASARDVRGALEAGITTVRLTRPGHSLDAEGPKPRLEVEDAADCRAARAVVTDPFGGSEYPIRLIFLKADYRGAVSELEPTLLLGG